MYVLAIDQSTSGTKALILTPLGDVVASCNKLHAQLTTPLGWIEHDPIEILNNTYAVIKQVLAESVISSNEIGAVGITNQRETAVCWNRTTGEPVYNAIVWQCGRAKDITDAMALKGFDTAIRQKTGLPLSPYFSGAKFAWILQNVPKAHELQQTGELCCGTIDSWLLYNLTEKQMFKTDYSNASRTQLMNLDTLKWDADVAKWFGINPAALPEICMSDSEFGLTDLGGILPTPVPILAMMGDSHAALFAHNCTQPYTAKATFGTGTSVMMNLGPIRQMPNTDGVVESLAWGINGEINYVLEGNINYSGAIIQWLIENMELLNNAKESGEIAKQVEDTGGVYLVPAFTGLGAPHWDNDARAAIVGMNYATRKAHIVRAAEEAIAYQIRDIVEELNHNCKSPLVSLAVDGGATKDEFLMGFVACQLDIELQVSKTKELSPAGVGYLAAIRAGFITTDEIFSRSRHTPIRPSMSEDKRKSCYNGWQRAIRMVKQKV